MTHLQIVHVADVVAPLGELDVRQRLLDVEVDRGAVVFLSFVDARVQKPLIQQLVTLSKAATPCPTLPETAEVITRPTGRNLVRAKVFTWSQLSKIST